MKEQFYKNKPNPNNNLTYNPNFIFPLTQNYYIPPYFQNNPDGHDTGDRVINLNTFGKF